MNIEVIQDLCRQFPGTTEDVKWGSDLCFCVGEKMFLVLGLDSTPTRGSFKATDADFEELIARQGMGPAKYLGRYKWVGIEDIALLRREEWREYAEKSYRLVAEKLPKKVQKEIGLL